MILSAGRKLRTGRRETLPPHGPRRLSFVPCRGRRGLGGVSFRVQDACTCARLSRSQMVRVRVRGLGEKGRRARRAEGREGQKGEKGRRACDAVGLERAEARDSVDRFLRPPRAPNLSPEPDTRTSAPSPTPEHLLGSAREGACPMAICRAWVLGRSCLTAHEACRLPNVHGKARVSPSRFLREKGMNNRAPRALPLPHHRLVAYQGCHRASRPRT